MAHHVQNNVRFSGRMQQHGICSVRQRDREPGLDDDGNREKDVNGKIFISSSVAPLLSIQFS